MECAGDRWLQTSPQAASPQVCVLTAPELRDSQAPALLTLGTTVTPARAAAAVQNGGASWTGCPKPLCFPQPWG